MLEKRELAWREEKREALAELDLAKEGMRAEHASKDNLKMAVASMPATVTQVVSHLPML